MLATVQVLKDHFIQIRGVKLKRTLAKPKFKYDGVCRHLLHHIEWAENGAFTAGDKAGKLMLQCLTNTFPV